MTNPAGAETATTYIGMPLQVEMRASMIMELDTPYQPPPPQIVPLRHYRAVMNDYLLMNGIPVSPPIFDATVPVTVTYTPGLAETPTTRPLPRAVNTGATLRWIADDQAISGDEETMTWVGMDAKGNDGLNPWTSYDVFRPLFNDDNTYAIGHELFARSGLVFDASQATNMSTQVSINDQASDKGVTWLIVAALMPLLAGQTLHSVLVTGDEIFGYRDLPFNQADSANGLQQELQLTPTGISVWQYGGVDFNGVPISPVQAAANYAVLTGSRPVAWMANFGMAIGARRVGPKNLTSVVNGPAQVRQSMDTSYALGRARNLVSASTSASMILYEVNYFDHLLSTTEIATALAAVTSCYGIDK
jgi:hypothetical protein